MPASEQALLTRTGLVSAATIGSRLLGFVRDAATAAVLGAGPAADAFAAALALPLLARRLLAEGAFNLAFIPALARADRAGPEAARALSLATLLVLVGVLGGMALGAALAMPLLMRLLAPGFMPDGPRADAAILCGRVAVLYLPLAGLAAVYGGIANAARRVLLAALAPLAANVTVLAVIAVLLAQDVLASDAAAFALAAATAAAGVSQWLLMRRAARGCPHTPRLADVARHPLPWRAAWTVLRAAAPALLFAGLSQFRLLIAAALASHADGAVAAMNYAQRLLDLPLGLVGASAGAVLLPLLVHGTATKDAAGSQTATRAMLAALGFALPAAAGLVALAHPIVVVLFQRGAFSSEDATLTAGLLVVLALALPAQGLERILSATAASAGRMASAERIALGSLALCLAAGAAGTALFGPMGAAAGVVVSAVASLGVFTHMLARAGAFVLDRRSAAAALGLCATALLMGVVVATANALWTMPDGEAARALRLAALIGLGIGVYGGGMLGLRRGRFPRGLVRSSTGGRGRRGPDHG